MPPVPYGPGWNSATNSYPTLPTIGTASRAGTTPVPSPTQGQGPFGLVPGPITVPNPAGDLASQFPNLGATNQQLSSDIYSKLQGLLSPSTLSAIQRQYGGQYGVASGMPGSGLSQSNVLDNIIGAEEQQRQQGIQDYNATLPTVSGTQTVSPALQTQIQEQNALNAAAPNPAQAQSYAQSLFNQYLSLLASSRRGPGGGTGGFSPFNPAGGTINPTATQGLGFGPTQPPPDYSGLENYGPGYGDITGTAYDINSWMDQLPQADVSSVATVPSDFGALGDQFGGF